MELASTCRRAHTGLAILLRSPGGTDGSNLLPSSGESTNFRFRDQNQHIVRAPATSGGGGQSCDTRRSSFGRGELPVLS
jgi:hypothetical protein